MLISIASVLRSILAWSVQGDAILTTLLPLLESTVKKQDVVAWKAAVDKLKKAFEHKYLLYKDINLVESLNPVELISRGSIDKAITFALENSKTDLSGLEKLKKDMKTDKPLNPQNYSIPNFFSIANADLQRMLSSKVESQSVDWDGLLRMVGNFKSHYIAAAPLMARGGVPPYMA